MTKLILLFAMRDAQTHTHTHTYTVHTWCMQRVDIIRNCRTAAVINYACVYMPTLRCVGVCVCVLFPHSAAAHLCGRLSCTSCCSALCNEGLAARSLQSTTHCPQILPSFRRYIACVVIYMRARNWYCS